ncbi:MAG: AmmeMemoRadiSam system protein A [Nitrospinales bacterium]
MSSNPNPYTALAAESVKYYLENGRMPGLPQNLPEELKKKAGVFVSIKKGKKLRGCIGTMAPSEDNLALEIIRNAVSAAAKDPRFDPVSKEELPSLTFSVDVLTPAEKADRGGLDCKKYGIMIASGHKQGILLPNLEGIDTVEEQIDICRKKAGLGKNEPIEIFRFRVERYS